MSVNRSGPLLLGVFIWFWAFFPASCLAAVDGVQTTRTGRIQPVAAPLVCAVEGGDRVPEWVANAAQCRVVTIAGEPLLAIEADRDPYERVEWQISLPGPAAGP